MKVSDPQPQTKTNPKPNGTKRQRPICIVFAYSALPPITALPDCQFSYSIIINIVVIVVVVVVMVVVVVVVVVIFVSVALHPINPSPHPLPSPGGTNQRTLGHICIRFAYQHFPSPMNRIRPCL